MSEVLEEVSSGGVAGCRYMSSKGIIIGYRTLDMCIMDQWNINY